jgi:hypothetical protein
MPLHRVNAWSDCDAAVALNGLHSSRPLGADVAEALLGGGGPGDGGEVLGYLALKIRPPNQHRRTLAEMGQFCAP